MNKIKVILNYNLCEEGNDLKFDDVDGDYIGEMIGQESANEIINSLDELDSEEATVQLVDDNGKVLKNKKVKINF